MHLSLGPTQNIIVAPITHWKVWAQLPCTEWPDPGRFSESQSSVGLLRVSAFLAAKRDSWIHILRLYFIKLAMLCSNFMSQNSPLIVHKWSVEKIRQSLMKYMHSLSFCPQDIAKSRGHFSNVGRDPSVQYEFVYHLKFYNYRQIRMFFRISN